MNGLFPFSNDNITGPIGVVWFVLFNIAMLFAYTCTILLAVRLVLA